MQHIVSCAQYVSWLTIFADFLYYTDLGGFCGCCGAGGLF